MLIKRIVQYITHDIWFKKEHEYKSRKVRWAVRQAKVFIFTIQGFGQHGILVQSAALTFYTLVPIAALVFAISKGFGLEARLNDYLYTNFPQYTVVIDQVIGFANALLQRTKGGVIASVGVVVLFWAVLKVFSNIESAFNNIWEVRRSRSIARKFSDYTTVIVIAPILGLISSSIGVQLQEQLLSLASTPIVRFLLGGASLLMLWVMFAFVYFVMPNTKVKFPCALVAGVIAGTLFQAFQYIYIYVQSNLTSYNAIYGSFAAVPLFLIWLQNSWQIVLFGAELSFSYQNIEKFEYEKQAKEMSYAYRKKAMLLVMHRITRHFLRGDGGTSPEVMAQELNLPVRIVRDATFDLERAELIVSTQSDEDKTSLYVPLRDIHALKISDVIRTVEQNGKASLDIQESAEFQRIESILDALERENELSRSNVRIMDIQ